MVDILLSESRLVEGLKGLGISPSDFQDILHLPVLSEHRTFAVDMRNESVVVRNSTCTKVALVTLEMTF